MPEDGDGSLVNPRDYAGLEELATRMAAVTERITLHTKIEEALTMDIGTRLAIRAAARAEANAALLAMRTRNGKPLKVTRTGEETQVYLMELFVDEHEQFLREAGLWDTGTQLVLIQKNGNKK